MKRPSLSRFAMLGLSFFLAAGMLLGACGDKHLHAKKNHKIKRHSGGIGAGMGG